MIGFSELSFCSFFGRRISGHFGPEIQTPRAEILRSKKENEDWQD